MKRRSIFNAIVLVALVATTFLPTSGAPSSTMDKSHIFMEQTPSVRRKDVAKTVRAASDAMHDLVFAVKPLNMDTLEAHLLDVSDPTSPRYGQHKTRAEVDAMTRNRDGQRAVLTHLRSVPGIIITDKTINGEYIVARAAVGVWEAFLDTTFHVYEHTRATPVTDAAAATISKLRGTSASSAAATATTMRKIIRCEQYSLPAALHPHVASVFNTVQMPMHRHRMGSKATRQSWDQQTPLDKAAQKWNIPAAKYTEPVPAAVPAAAHEVTVDAVSTRAVYSGFRPTVKNCFLNNTITPCRLRQVYSIKVRVVYDGSISAPPAPHIDNPVCAGCGQRVVDAGRVRVVERVVLPLGFEAVSNAVQARHTAGGGAVRPRQRQRGVPEAPRAVHRVHAGLAVHDGAVLDRR